MSEPPTFALSPAPSNSAPVHLNFIEKLGGCKGEVCFEYSSDSTDSTDRPERESQRLALFGLTAGTRRA